MTTNAPNEKQCYRVYTMAGYFVVYLYNKAEHMYEQVIHYHKVGLNRIYNENTFQKKSFNII